MANLSEENFNLREDLQRGLSNYYQSMRKNKERYGARFGRGQFYQSLPGVVEGQRPTGERIITYKLLDFLKKNHSVLDLGSNCGFFSLSIAEYVDKVVGVEISPELIAIANTARDGLNAKNCEFKVTSFNDFKTEDKYDFIFSLAIHGWAKTSFEEFLIVTPTFSYSLS